MRVGDRSMDEFRIEFDKVMNDTSIPKWKRFLVGLISLVVFGLVLLVMIPVVLILGIKIVLEEAWRPIAVIALIVAIVWSASQISQSIRSGQSAQPVATVTSK